MNFQISTNKKNDTCKLKFNFDDDNVKSAITTMQVLEKNTREQGYFVEFDPKNQKFYNDNIQKYKQLKEKENAFFSKFSNKLFDTMINRQYNIQGIMNDIKIIYEREKFFDDIEHNLPIKINYRFVKSKNDNFAENMLLDITNLNDLIKKYGQGVVLFVSQVFVDNMNKQDKKEQEKLGKNSIWTLKYALGPEIKKSCFDEKHQTHVFLETLEGDDYIIDSSLGKVLSQTLDINEILELTYIIEQVKENIRKQNNNLKI